MTHDVEGLHGAATVLGRNLIDLTVVLLKDVIDDLVLSHGYAARIMVIPAIYDGGKLEKLVGEVLPTVMLAASELVLPQMAVFAPVGLVIT